MCQNLQHLLNDIFNETNNNDLLLNPNKFIAIFFTPDNDEHSTTLTLKIKGILIPKYTLDLKMQIDLNP